MRSTWTDSRLDDLNGRVNELSGRVNELSSRIDALQHAITNGFIAMTATMIAGFLGLAGLITTQL